MSTYASILAGSPNYCISFHSNNSKPIFVPPCIYTQIKPEGNSTKCSKGYIWMCIWVLMLGLSLFFHFLLTLLYLKKKIKQDNFP